MINEKSLERANELNKIGLKNNEQKWKVQTGTDPKNIELYNKNKSAMLKYFNATEDDWENYKWQLSNRISDADTLNKIFDLDEKRYEEIKKVSEKNIWSVSPYYLSLVDINDVFDPVGLICLPNVLELQETGELDPMGEEFTNPAEAITRRYPDRIIVNVTNMCGMYCRFCQRKRNFSDSEYQKSSTTLQETIQYIKDTPTIRDVLITGGDPLTLATEALEKIISEVRAIDHVEIIRIGTRVPVSLPQRVDEKLVNMLKKYHPIFVNTHFNHPKEITESSKKACSLLADAGIPLGNQAVLLNGVNNNKYTFLRLNQELLKCRVRPYYIFQAKKVMGTTHFNCDINEGIEIVNFLRGNTSGLAIPEYIVNAPQGFGKVSFHKKNYEFDDNNEFVKLKTWEGREMTYENPTTTKLEDLYRQCYDQYMKE